jgi:sarcosine oxidase subunit alpha
MSEPVRIIVNGEPLEVAAGSTIAGALLSIGVNLFRKSVSGEPRGPLCGMGICFECRVTVNGQPHVRACQALCRNGMNVRTNE